MSGKGSNQSRRTYVGVKAETIAANLARIQRQNECRKQARQKPASEALKGNDDA